MPPSETEAEEIQPLLTRIVQLKAVTNKELNDTQLIVFFLQRESNHCRPECQNCGLTRVRRTNLGFLS
jgi:hypothetical protein